MFTNAIVKTPCKNLANGITSASLGKPDYQKALQQHKEYINALEQCDVNVTTLDADESFPDSTFVEDTALCTHNCAIITNPGAITRQEEVIDMAKHIVDFFTNVMCIEAPGTVEAGDIMMVGKHFYIGLSERTNTEGAQQMIKFLEKFGHTGSTVTMSEVLHLKTGLSYLEHNNLLACGEFLKKPEFQSFNILEVHPDESYAANSVWVNDTVLIPQGFPKTQAMIEKAGYKTLSVDVSEFRKVDGGLSCLSLRF